MKLMRYGSAIERLGDRYRLDGMLGSGGMADVCLAWDEREQREVAIKVIKEDNLDQKALDRFQKEASQVVGWSHPHILRIYDDLKLELLNAKSGSIVPYIVVEYAQGGDLHKRLRLNQPYPLKEALLLFEQLCGAVQYAHEHGVIHRDLKPLNILFRVLPDGTEQVVLSDFGLAVQIDATHHTFANAGTLAYMAPEQLRGQSTPASDIFALGVILYQLCTGKLPFRRSLQDLRAASFTEIPPLPSTINPLLPEALDEVILTALSEEQAKRFPSAAQFWESIRTAIDATTMPGPISATPVETNGQTQTASLNPIKSMPSMQIPPIMIVEQPVMQAPNVMNFVPPPVENTGRLSQYESVVEHVPIAKLNKASPNSSIRYERNNQDSVLNASNSMVAPVVNSYRQNIVEPSQIINIAAPDGNQTGKRSHTFRLRLLVALALIVLAILVIFAGVFYLVPGLFGTLTQSAFYSPGNTVTLVPASQSVSGNFAILAVTGTSDSSQREVQARELSYTTPVQSKTVNATGVVNAPGTRATGTLTFYNANFTTYTVSAGTVITGNSGVAIITNSPAYIPAAVFGGGYGTTSVNAHAANIGASGNIGALDISKVCCGSGAVTVRNLGAFGGGQDPQHYTAVQQSDIDNVANPLVNPTEQSALITLKGQRHANEQLVAQPKCTPNVNANPAVGSKSQTVTVTVSASCSGEVYDQRGAFALAATSLANQASKVPGASYKLVGQIVPTITQLAVVDNKGTISMVVKAEGIWEYNFDKTQEAQLAQQIAGKSQSAAQALLAGQAGVGKIVSISLSTGSTLPTDVTQIHFVIQDAPGLTGTPTSSGSPTTITPTTGPGTAQPGSGLISGNGTT